MTERNTCKKTNTKAKTHIHRQIQSASKTQCMLYFFQGRMFSGPTIFSGVNIFLGWKFFRSTHSLNIWFSQNLLGLVSLSTLDFRGSEEKFLFLLAISESFILKFSFILGTLGFWCFWMKKNHLQVTSTPSLEISISTLLEIWALDFPFSSRNSR